MTPRSPAGSTENLTSHHQTSSHPSSKHYSYIVTKTAQFTYPIDQRCMNTAKSTALRKHSIVPGIRATPVPLPTRWKGGHIYQLPHSITPTPASPISCRYSILLFDALPYLVFKRKGLFLFKGSTAQDYLHIQNRQQNLGCVITLGLLYPEIMNQLFLRFSSRVIWKNILCQSRRSKMVESRIEMQGPVCKIQCSPKIRYVIFMHSTAQSTKHFTLNHVFENQYSTPSQELHVLSYSSKLNMNSMFISMALMRTGGDQNQWGFIDSMDCYDLLQGGRSNPFPHPEINQLEPRTPEPQNTRPFTTPKREAMCADFHAVTSATACSFVDVTTGKEQGFYQGNIQINHLFYIKSVNFSQCQLGSVPSMSTILHSTKFVLVAVYKLQTAQNCIYNLSFNESKCSKKSIFSVEFAQVDLRGSKCFIEGSGLLLSFPSFLIILNEHQTISSVILSTRTSSETILPAQLMVVAKLGNFGKPEFGFSQLTKKKQEEDSSTTIDWGTHQAFSWLISNPSNMFFFCHNAGCIGLCHSGVKINK
ncbi:hypothetical protein VP01_1266g2 [Puccinia sorghi]|uniref:Uncharacterized protein n=1 Tax=Puccinia sorghi TaxID=27349 RepID=A0A0L6VPC7_9BASI|nr:hypothetical protein VP01_1266g2 [Puccinia sorghi]